QRLALGREPRRVLLDLPLPVEQLRCLGTQALLRDVQSRLELRQPFLFLPHALTVVREPPALVLEPPLVRVEPLALVLQNPELRRQLIPVGGLERRLELSDAFGLGPQAVPLLRQATLFVAEERGAIVEALTERRDALALGLDARPISREAGDLPGEAVALSFERSPLGVDTGGLGAQAVAIGLEALPLLGELFAITLELLADVVHPTDVQGHRSGGDGREV